MAARRFEIYLVALEPTVGSEMGKTRPCVVISPDEMNASVRTVVVAPLTSSHRRSPMRVPCRVNDVDGFVALDHVRSVDRSRLLYRLGDLDIKTAEKVLATLRALFAS